jgi:hypothetical protein
MRRAAVFLALAVMGAARAEPSFSDWLNAAPERRSEVAAFEAYLDRAQVGGVLATDLLLRNASSWQACKLGYPWSMPPRPLWGHVVPTLKFIRDVIAPATGPLTVESGWREPRLNTCSGGAAKSAHAQYYALDLVPLVATSRRDLIDTVCRLHAAKGKAYNVGLGFYEGVRFHIDTKAYRRWGSDNHGKTSPCAAVSG